MISGVTEGRVKFIIPSQLLIVGHKNMFAFTQLIFDYAVMIVKDNCIQANAELLENSDKFLQILFLR